jgi:hypothetical protein
MKKVHIVTADFGNPNASDNRHMVLQNTEYHISTMAYTDTNFGHSRELALHPRLKGKIPKMLEWKKVDADFYIWMDSNFKITSPLFVDEMIKAIGDYDICLHKHPNRNSILDEAKYVHYNVLNNHSYLTERYKGEPIVEQINSYMIDTSFKDLNLFSLGFFIFNKRIIENKNYNVMTDWFFHFHIYYKNTILITQLLHMIFIIIHMHHIFLNKKTNVFSYHTYNVEM